MRYIFLEVIGAVQAPFDTEVEGSVLETWICHKERSTGVGYR